MEEGYSIGEWHSSRKKIFLFGRKALEEIQVAGAGHKERKITQTQSNEDYKGGI